jgi:nucleoside-diphosphate-sugar epimerase
MRVLIAGCGDVGTEVGLRLAAAGHRVTGLRRSPAVLPAAIEPLAGDLGGQLPPLPADTEVVVHAAAAGGRDVDTYRRVYLDGLDRVLDGLDAVGAPLRRVLFVASTAVYGVSDGSWVDEDTPTEPASATGEVLVAAERRLWERVGDRGTSLRLAGIYGPGRTRLIDQVRDGRAVRPDPPVHANRIHRDDAAAAVVHLITGVEAPARAYLGVDHAPVDRGEVLAFLADELGLPQPPTGGDTRARGGDKRCSNARLVATGFTFTYPTYREGYRAVLAGEGVRHS